MKEILNIAVNPQGIGGTETFSRILNRNFPTSRTLSFRKAHTPIFDVTSELIPKRLCPQIARLLPFCSYDKSKLYKLPLFSDGIIIFNAPSDLDFFSREYLKSNRVLYLVHNEPQHIWEHKNYFGSNRDKRLAALQYVDQIICLSEEYRKPLSKYLKYPLEKIHVVTHSVEPVALTSPKRLQKKIITISRLDQKQKRFDRFVEVAQAFPDYTFEIYGMGKDAALVKEMTDPLANTSFMGKTSDISGVHAAAGIFLMTSDFEGLSIAVLESLSQATPVIIAKNSFGMAREIVHDGYNGFVDENFSVEQVVGHIKEIEVNYSAYSQNAIDSFAPFSNDSFVKQWQAIFNRLH